jgi:hypothetical protein
VLAHQGQATDEEVEIKVNSFDELKFLLPVRVVLPSVAPVAMLELSPVTSNILVVLPKGIVETGPLMGKVRLVKENRLAPKVPFELVDAFVIEATDAEKMPLDSELIVLLRKSQDNCV